MSNINLFAGLPLNTTIKPLASQPQAEVKAPEAAKAAVKDSVALGGTYTVRTQDTLWGISSKVLGDATRWPEIFALNQDKIQDPDLIFPGTVLKMPTPAKHTAPEAPAQHHEPSAPAKHSEPTKAPTEPSKPATPVQSHPATPAPAAQPSAPANPQYPTVGEYVKQRYDSAVDSTVTGLHAAAEIALPPLLLGEIAGIKAKHQEAALKQIWNLPMDPQGKWKVQAQKISDAESAAANAEIKALPGVRTLSAAGDAIGDGVTWTGQQIKNGANAAVNGMVDAGVAVGKGVQWTGQQIQYGAQAVGNGIRETGHDIAQGAEAVGTAVAHAPKEAARGVFSGIGSLGSGLQHFSQWALGGLGN